MTATIIATLIRIAFWSLFMAFITIASVHCFKTNEDQDQ